MKLADISLGVLLILLVSDAIHPGATSRYRSTECCLLPCQQPRHRNKQVFGAESLRPASLLCTLRAHQSPGEWQHSLPACSLALAGRDLHPLDSNKKFHHLIFGSSSAQLSQRDNNVGDVKHYVHFQLLSHHQHSVWQHQWVAGWNRRDRTMTGTDSTDGATGTLQLNVTQ